MAYDLNYIGQIFYFKFEKKLYVGSHLNKKYQSQVLMFPEVYLYLRFSPVSLIDLSMLD